MTDSPAADTRDPVLPLPMFPLQSVLVPYGVLPLHCFEPRYQALGRDLARGNGEFGVVLIERGSEVGGGERRTTTGTVARVLEAAEYPDGRWDLLAVGTRRIEVQTWLPDDPYPLALVQDRRDTPVAERDAYDLSFTAAESAVRRAAVLRSELGEGSATVDLSDDRERAGWELVMFAPIGPLDRHELLGIDDPTARLARLAEMAEDARALLAYRLTGG